MQELSKANRRYLKGLAHSMKPMVQVGKQGVTDTVVDALDEVLEAHELVKVKFIDHKDEKNELADALADRTRSYLVGVLGNIATFYRQQEDESKRNIILKEPLG